MRGRELLRIIAINLAVSIGLLLVLLFVASLVGDISNLAKVLFPKEDERATLPAYDDHERARLVYRDQDDSIKDYVPFVEWRHAAKKTETLNIDEHGYRTHTVGLDNAADAESLGFFGGSTVWGTGVDDNGTLPARFDAITRSYRVTNYGERGYTVMQNLIDLITLINQNEAPHTVLFLTGFNEVWVHCNLAVTTRINGHMQERRIQAALDRTAKRRHLFNNFVAPLQVLIGGLVRRDRDLHIAGCSNDPGRAARVAEMIVRNLEIAEQIVRANGGRFHAFLQPTAYVGHPRVDYLDLTGPKHEGQRPEFAAVYPLIQSEITARQQPWLHDLSNALDGDEYLLVDHVHVTRRGNTILALRIRDELASHDLEAGGGSTRRAR